MLSLLISAIVSVLNWLPESFVQSFIASNLYGYAKIIPILGYINYFFPVYILQGMIALWIPIMIAVFVYYKISNK